jgi:hypothetical protein
MGFWGKREFQDDERRKCIAYLEEQWKIQSFQKKESDFYDNSVINFSSSSVTDSRVAKEMRRATSRLVQSINESLKRLRSISSVPDAASRAWHDWELRYSDYLAWATVQMAIGDALLSNQAHAEAQFGRLNKLALQRDESLRKAMVETIKLMRRLELTEDEHSRLFQVAEDALKENWQPEEISKSYG